MNVGSGNLWCSCFRFIAFNRNVTSVPIGLYTLLLQYLDILNLLTVLLFRTAICSGREFKIGIFHAWKDLEFFA